MPVSNTAPALGVFDQVGWNGQCHLPVLALDHVLEAADQTTAGNGVELDGRWSGVERFLQQLVHDLRVGLAARRLHDLADEPAE